MGIVHFEKSDPVSERVVWLCLMAIGGIIGSRQAGDVVCRSGALAARQLVWAPASRAGLVSWLCGARDLGKRGLGILLHEELRAPRLGADSCRCNYLDRSGILAQSEPSIPCHCVFQPFESHRANCRRVARHAWLKRCMEG